jgi:hypothetical protein
VKLGCFPPQTRTSSSVPSKRETRSERVSSPTPKRRSESEIWRRPASERPTAAAARPRATHMTGWREVEHQLAVERAGGEARASLRSHCLEGCQLQRESASHLFVRSEACCAERETRRTHERGVEEGSLGLQGAREEQLLQRAAARYQRGRMRPRRCSRASRWSRLRTARLAGCARGTPRRRSAATWPSERCPCRSSGVSRRVDRIRSISRVEASR